MYIFGFIFIFIVLIKLVISVRIDIYVYMVRKCVYTCEEKVVFVLFSSNAS